MVSTYILMLIEPQAQLYLLTISLTNLLLTTIWRCHERQETEEMEAVKYVSAFTFVDSLIWYSINSFLIFHICFRLGMYVRLHGHLKSFQGKRSVNVFSIRFVSWHTYSISLWYTCSVLLGFLDLKFLFDQWFFFLRGSKCYIFYFAFVLVNEFAAS